MCLQKTLNIQHTAQCAAPPRKQLVALLLQQNTCSLSGRLTHHHVTSCSSLTGMRLALVETSPKDAAHLPAVLLAGGQGLQLLPGDGQPSRL
jgi:hypothetical protein